MSVALKSSRPGLLKRVMQSVTAFFTHDVEIKRADDGLKLVLQHAAVSYTHLTLPTNREV